MAANLFGTIRRLMIVLTVATLAGCVTIPGVPEGTKEETVFIERVNSGGQSVKLEVLIFLPPGQGPFDVVLYSHGGHNRDNPRNIAKDYQKTVTPPFLKRGIAVVMPIRQGRGNSGGEPANTRCNLDESLQGYENEYKDVVAGLEFIQSSPLFAGKRVYAIGHSRGGYLSAALALNRPTEIAGAVGFGAGWQAVGIPTACRNGQFLHNAYMERLAYPFAAKTLFIYDQTDNFYPPASNQEAFARYWAKGGKGELKVYPPSGGRQANWSDGHFMMASVNTWEQDVMEFLGIK